MFKPH